MVFGQMLGVLLVRPNEQERISMLLLLSMAFFDSCFVYLVYVFIFFKQTHYQGKNTHTRRPRQTPHAQWVCVFVAGQSFCCVLDVGVVQSWSTKIDIDAAPLHLYGNIVFKKRNRFVTTAAAAAAGSKSTKNFNPT